MSIGVETDPTLLVLTKGRDFKWSFQNLDEVTGAPVNFPSGTLYFELETNPITTWTFSIGGSVATIKVESTAVDLIPPRTRWQLVWRQTGETAGGDPVARGIVLVQR